MTDLPGPPSPLREPGAVSRDLSARAASLALRLASFVEENTSEEAGAGTAVGFLRRWARSALQAALGSSTGGPRPSPGVDLPLGQLVARLQLTDTERDLVLLAGLPEEHEALANTFRQMDPGRAPHPSIGLVAHALGADRIALRRLLHEGSAVRTGALRVLSEGPFFERGLGLAPQLWDALHGNDAWPEAIERVELGPAPAGLEQWLGLPEVRRVVLALRSPQPRTLLVTADDEAIALSRCAALAEQAEAVLVAGRARPESGDTIGLPAVHAAVRGGLPLLVVTSPPQGETAGTLDLHRVLGPVLACGAPGTLRPDALRPVLPVPPGRIGVADRRAAWRAALPEASDHAPQLAARHPLDPALTAQVALDVRSRPQLPGEPRTSSGPEPADVAAAIRARAGAALPAGIELVRPDAGWQRLGLEPGAAQQGRDAVPRPQHPAPVLDDWGSARPPGPTGGSGCCSPVRQGPASRWPRRCSPPPPEPTCWSWTCPGWCRSGSARPRRTSPPRSTSPSAPRPCCSSTRPTPSSAPAPRSPTRTTATPTSRPPTCSSGWTTSTGWRCSPRTWTRTSTRRSCAGWTTSSSSRCPTSGGAGSCGSCTCRPGCWPTTSTRSCWPSSTRSPGRGSATRRSRPRSRLPAAAAGSARTSSSRPSSASTGKPVGPSRCSRRAGLPKRGTSRRPVPSRQRPRSGGPRRRHDHRQQPGRCPAGCAEHART